MLQLNQVSLRRGSRLLLEDVNLQVNAGQRLGLTGANGTGKTSLFELILGHLDTDHGSLSMPPDYLVGQVSQQSPDSKRSAVDFVMDGDQELRQIQQQLASADPEKAPDQVHHAYERMDAIDGYTAEARAGQLLHGLGFSPDQHHQPVNAFSGGWRMRLSLAQALMCRSDLLLLDEPTNHLDLPAILWLESWLKRYPGILLVISHDRDFLDGVCTRIAHIENQQLKVYGGNYSQFEEVRAEQLAQQSAMYDRQQKEIRHIQSYVDRFRYKASKARQAQSRLKMLERMTRIAPAHVDSPFHFHFLAPEKQPQHLLALDHVDAGYCEDQPVLRDIELVITAGQRLGLLGVNGAGKSTVVKALADGSTVLTGERVIHKDTRIGYFAQHQLDLLNPDASPIDHLKRDGSDDREQDLRNFLGRFGFNGERIFEPVEPFSGGEKARLVLALIIRQKPSLLLLDEPTNHLDLEMRQALSLALTEYEGALVVISHDRHLLRSVCDELFIVHAGRVTEFDQGIDDYPDWLAEHAVGSGDQQSDAPADDDSRPSRRQQRQEEARAREQLKPLMDQVRDIDKKMSALRAELTEIEQQLADESLYAEGVPLDKLESLTRAQADKKDALASLEWDWLEASELLENKQRQVKSN